MALRAKEADVRDVADLGDDVNVLPFLRTANKLTDYVSSQDAGGILTAAVLKEIEQYLAAHFAVCNRDKAYTSKSTGGASGSFQGQYAMRLESTDQGQTAMLLDFTGTLKRLNKPESGKVQVMWLGKKPSEQTPYDQRS